MRPTRALLLVGLAALSVACKPKPEAFDYQHDVERAEQDYQLQRLGFVCDGRRYPDAPAHDPKPGAPSPTAMFRNYNSYGPELRWRPASEFPWAPSKTREAALVACVQYSHGNDYTPKVRMVRVKDASTLATFDVELPQFGGDSDRTNVLIESIRPHVEGTVAPEAEAGDAPEASDTPEAGDAP